MTATMNRAPLTRLAGVLYLIIILCGVGSEALVRGPLLAGDTAGLTARLAAAELPFRLSVLADVLMALSDVGVGALLYFLFAPVDRVLSLTAMAFRLAQAAILGLNLQNLDRALALSQGDGAPALASDASIRAALEAHATGYDLGLFFFAVNCLLVGALIRRASFIAAAYGWLLSAAGLVYLIGSTLRVIAPAYAEAFAPAYVIPLIAELGFCVWLLRQPAGAAPSRS